MVNLYINHQYAQDIIYVMTLNNGNIFVLSVMKRMGNCGILKFII